MIESIPEETQLFMTRSCLKAELITTSATNSGEEML